MKINNRYLIKTVNGYQKFDSIQKTIQKGLIIKTNVNIIKCTKTHRMLVNGEFKQAKDLKIGDILNNQIIELITDEEDNKEYFDPINVQGDNTYIAQDIIHHNCAIVVVDECVAHNEIITLRNDETGEIFDIKIGDFYNDIGEI